MGYIRIETNGTSADELWYLIGARYYDPEIARWISIDPNPTDVSNGLSPFVYCWNNPLNNTDNNGKFVTPIGTPDEVKYTQENLPKLVDAMGSVAQSWWQSVIDDPVFELQLTLHSPGWEGKTSNGQIYAGITTQTKSGAKIEAAATVNTTGHEGGHGFQSLQAFQSGMSWLGRAAYFSNQFVALRMETYVYTKLNDFSGMKTFFGDWVARGFGSFANAAATLSSNQAFRQSDYWGDYSNNMMQSGRDPETGGRLYGTDPVTGEKQYWDER